MFPNEVTTEEYPEPWPTLDPEQRVLFKTARDVYFQQSQAFSETMKSQWKEECDEYIDWFSGTLELTYAARHRFRPPTWIQFSLLKASYGWEAVRCSPVVQNLIAAFPHADLSKWAENCKCGGDGGVTGRMGEWANANMHNTTSRFAEQAANHRIDTEKACPGKRSRLGFV